MSSQRDGERGRETAEQRKVHLGVINLTKFTDRGAEAESPQPRVTKTTEGAPTGGRGWRGDGGDGKENKKERQREEETHNCTRRAEPSLGDCHPYNRPDQIARSLSGPSKSASSGESRNPYFCNYKAID